MLVSPRQAVAPYTGAWIEIVQSSLTSLRYSSHPTRVRGLKFGYMKQWIKEHAVAPYTGAWIEIELAFVEYPEQNRRTLHGCVD